MDEAALAGWAAHEFGAAELGDARRTARLVALAGALGASPAATLPEACGEPAALQAADRFFDADGVPPDALLAGHVRATYARLAAVPLVLAAQDTTLLDWTHHPATTGLGPLGSAPAGAAGPQHAGPDAGAGAAGAGGPAGLGARRRHLRAAARPAHARDCGEGEPAVAHQLGGRGRRACRPPAAALRQRRRPRGGRGRPVRRGAPGGGGLAGARDAGSRQRRSGPPSRCTSPGAARRRRGTPR
jgi:Transposase DNA-binding